MVGKLNTHKYSRYRYRDNEDFHKHELSKKNWLEIFILLGLFNPKNKLWSIYWADSNQGVLQPPVLGSFENNVALRRGFDYKSENRTIYVYKSIYH